MTGTKTKGIRVKLYDGSTLLEGMKSADLTENMGQEDITGTDEAVDAIIYGPTVADSDLSMDLWYKPDNSAHAGLITKLKAGTGVSMTAIWSGTKGSGSAIGSTFTFNLSQIKRSSGGIKGYQSMSVQGKISGAVTESSTL